MPDSASIFNDLIREFGFSGMDIRPQERTATLFARPKPREGTLMRIAAWGMCATLSTALLVFVAQTPAGGERIKLALAGLDDPVQPVAASADADLVVRSLEARVATLTGDRDRLAKRVAALENGFDDLTGSVGKQGSAPPAPAGERSEPVAMVVAVAPPLINPLATPPAGIASILPETPKSEPQPAAAETAAPEASAPETAPANEVPLPPERAVASAEPAEAARPAEAAKPAAPVHVRPEFGVELATEANLESLRKRWSGVKANYGPLLLGLSPVAVRDQHPGSTNVRLVAGPLPSLTAARQLCARFARLNGDCWPARINPADVIQR
ncbi:MAG TPA: hypothetical protein VN655_18225 [Pseudolabrys sp.]|nr:hypothetical protein [Pseudolabrys sp.]